MATATTKRLNATLADLGAAVKEAEERERELQAQHRRAGLETHQVEAELRDLLELAEEAGEEPDPKQLQALRSKLRDAEQVTVVRPAPGGGVEFINPEVEARLTGARRVVEQRRQELRAFVEQHRPQLAAERWEGDRQAADQLHEAVTALDRALVGWLERARYHVTTLGIDQSKLPAHPFPLDQQLVVDFLRRDRAAITPAPTWLVEQEQS